MKELAIATIALVLLAIAYWAAYAAMLEGIWYWRDRAAPPGPATSHAEYRIEGRAVELFFAPANAVDRMVRPNEWN